MKNVEKMRIIKTDFGIAYQYDKTIEINPVLREFPRLYRETLQHEKEHAKSNKQMDFWLDIKDSLKFNKEWIKFFIKHPKANLQAMCPVWIHKNQFNYNLFLILFYSMLIALMTVGFIIMRR